MKKTCRVSAQYQDCHLLLVHLQPGDCWRSTKWPPGSYLGACLRQNCPNQGVLVLPASSTTIDRRSGQSHITLVTWHVHWQFLDPLTDWNVTEYLSSEPTRYYQTAQRASLYPFYHCCPNRRENWAPLWTLQTTVPMVPWWDYHSSCGCFFKRIRSSRSEPYFDIVGWRCVQHRIRVLKQRRERGT